MKYVLALDQGTTSSRAILFDAQGKIIAKSQNEFTQIYPQSGWVEHDPMELLQSQFKAMSEVVRISGVPAGSIVCIGITNQRETTVVWDKKTGRPIANAIVWQCRRTAGICEKLMEDGLDRYIKEKTGLLIDAYFSATKIKWILDNNEGSREKAQKGDVLFGTIDTWLIWNLTKGKVHVTDYSNASRTMLFNISELKWDKFLCDKLEIPVEMLPEVKPSSYVYGYVAGGIDGLRKFEGIPICGAAGDQQAALFGQACFKPGMMKNTYGTGCFFLMNTGTQIVKSQNNLVSSIAWGLDGKVEYVLEGSIFNAGSVIKWLRDKLKIIKTASECDELAESVQNSDGVFFVPAFTGLGAPYWDMYARGTIIGLTAATSNAHLARAVIECIAFQVIDLLNAIKKDTNIELTELRVDGGASVSNVLMQFQADMLNIPVNRPKIVETAALGAAYLAGLAAGVWKSVDEISSYREIDKIFVPVMQADKRNELYEMWKCAVQRSMNWLNK
jgi:glycerol kinase